MDLSRRSYLSSLGLAALASMSGCPSESGQTATSEGASTENSTTPSPTEQQRATASPATTTRSTAQTTEQSLGTISPPEDCPDEPQVPEAQPHPEGEALPPIPDPPDSLADEATVVEYVEAYETAYQWRRAVKILNSPIISAQTGMSSKVRDSRQNAVLVDLNGVSIHGEYGYENESVAHFDNGQYAVRYLITDLAVWRDSKPRYTREPTPELDPRGKGELLECY